MTKIPLRVGDAGTIGACEYRVVAGTKGPDDTVLELRVREWAHVPMGLGLLMAQFFYDNEERLYPRRYGNRGGFMYLDVAASAALNGWEWGAVELERLRARARARRDRGT